MSSSAHLIPHIPEDAPFNPAQRAWLNGFLAGLYSYAPAEPTSHQRLRIALLYGSQTGTAEGLARKLAKDLRSKGHEVALDSLEGYVPATLSAETHAIFIASTYGEGEAPDTAQAFFQQLCVERFPLLGNLSYALLALGDSHYEHFCQFGRDLDAKLQALGATPILDRTESDIDVDAPFFSWKDSLNTRLRELAHSSPADAPILSADIADITDIAAPTPNPSPSTTPTTSTPTRDNPYLAPIAEKRALTHPSSTKSTLHLDFDIAGSTIHYEAGDACAIVPENSAALVETILSLLPFTGHEPVELPKLGSVPLIDALRHHLILTRLTRKMVAHYAELAQCKLLTGLLGPEQQSELEQYLHGRDLIDLLTQCPGAIQSAQDLIEMLPKLTPRLYSISSSPAAHPGRVHTTVSVVRYRTHNRDRGGVCSTLLADRISVGDRLPVYIQPNKKFRLPADSTGPVIMIGPGTGIAPFRAFLHQRRATAATGRNWLFFGERSAATDFLYREELEAMRSDGHLTRLDTAFSRDQQQKIYVQDLMQKNATALWLWLQEGASIYVCGDASRMAKDVDKTLHTIAQQQGSLSPDDAELYLQALKDDHRYQRDVY
jgi:sulfite reductase (NADPH) flavoprotein alpha-component